jgi:CheY-like chemotaxis protein
MPGPAALAHEVPGTRLGREQSRRNDAHLLEVVIVSADATPGQVRRMRELGAAEYLTKPLDVPRFLDDIDGIIELEEA